MSFISKLFVALNYVFSMVFPFILIFLIIFSLIFFLYKKDIISLITINVFSLFSLINIFSIICLFFTITLSLYLPSIYRYTSIVSYILICLLFISLLGQEITILKSFTDFVKVKNIWVLCGNEKTIIEKISCLLIGYMPTSSISMIEAIIIIYGFYLYAFALPIIICYFLTKNLIDLGNVINNESYKKIISFGFAILVYRKLIVSKLIDFLYIGYIGVGLIIINFIVLNFILKKIRSIYAKIKIAEEKETKKRNINELKVFVKKSLEKLKLIPSINLISVIFEDRIRSNLKTIFEYQNKVTEFENLITEFENAINQKNKSALLATIDRMIAAIN
ncbi:MAG: hypothetical protein QXJ06_02925 [Candidatus Aenigmatarchaeota archaeon]